MTLPQFKLFKKDGRQSSIVFRISAIIVLILSTMIFFLFLSNLYAYQIATRNIVQQQKSLMSLAMEQIDAELSAASTTLNEMSLDNLGKLNSYQQQDSLKRYVASVNMTSVLENKVRSNEALACLYFAYPEGSTYLFRYQSQVDWSQKFAIEDYIKANPTLINDAVDGHWHLLQLGGSYYLMQTYTLQQIRIGAFVELDRFVSILKNTSNARNVQYLITDENGVVLAGDEQDVLGDSQTKPFPNETETTSNYQGRYTVITEQYPRVSLRISGLLANEDIYYGLENAQYLIIALSVLAVAGVVLCTAYLKRQIAGPVTRLAEATKQIEGGNIDYQIPQQQGDASEFRSLIDSFNNMTQEIKDLKISTYEEKLERQSAELKYLQMQISPHFYLNAINTISSLSMRGQNKEIQQFIAALSVYLRYLFTNNHQRTTIETEIDHAVAYIRLQRIRFPGLIFYYADVEEDVRDVPVQKLLIQTFVENIFKHAFDGKQTLSIFLRVQHTLLGAVPCAKVTIEDTGCGFTEEFLADFPPQNGEKVGLANIAQTLVLTYGRADLLRLSNSELGGARVELWLPEHPERNDSNEAFDRG